MEGCCPVSRRHLDFSGNREFMVRPVDSEDPVHAHRGFSLGCYLSVYSIGSENNFRIAVTLQNFFMHFAVAHAVAALASPGVDHDFAGQFTGGGRQAQRAFLQMKCSVNRVKHVA